MDELMRQLSDKKAEAYDILNYMENAQKVLQGVNAEIVRLSNEITVARKENAITASATEPEPAPAQA